MAQGNFIQSGTAVSDPSQIERELVRIWRDAAREDAANEKGSGDAPARIRTVLANMVLLHRIEGDGRSERKMLDGLITELCITHPSRFFIVGMHEKQPSAKPLEASVSSRCVLANSGAHVCSEEVYLSADESGILVLPNLLLSLLVADLPVIILTLGELSQPNATDSFLTLYRGIGELADRVIFDSSSSKNFLGCCENMFSLIQATRPDAGPRSVYLFDLTWERLKRWRVRIADEFRNARLRDISGSISNVTLRANVVPEVLLSNNIPADIMLLSGWLMDCLEFTPKTFARLDDGSGIRISGERPGTPIDLEIIGASAMESTRNDSTLDGVAFALNENGHEVLLHLNDLAAERTLEISLGISKPDGVEATCRRVPFAAEASHNMILGCIIRANEDAIFLTAVRNAKKLADFISKKVK